MKKQVIRLTESDLHKLIQESVNTILSELDWRTYDSARNKALDDIDGKDIFTQERRKNQHHMRRKPARLGSCLILT